MDWLWHLKCNGLGLSGHLSWKRENSRYVRRHTSICQHQDERIFRRYYAKCVYFGVKYKSEDLTKVRHKSRSVKTCQWGGTGDWNHLFARDFG